MPAKATRKQKKVVKPVNVEKSEELEIKVKKHPKTPITKNNKKPTLTAEEKAIAKKARKEKLRSFRITDATYNGVTYHDIGGRFMGIAPEPAASKAPRRIEYILEKDYGIKVENGVQIPFTIVETTQGRRMKQFVYIETAKGRRMKIHNYYTFHYVATIDLLDTPKEVLRTVPEGYDPVEANKAKKDNKGIVSIGISATAAKNPSLIETNSYPLFCKKTGKLVNLHCRKITVRKDETKSKKNEGVVENSEKIAPQSKKKNNRKNVKKNVEVKKESVVDKPNAKKKKNSKKTKPVVDDVEEPVVEDVEEPVVEDVEEPVVEDVEEPVVETLKKKKTTSSKSEKKEKKQRTKKQQKK